MQEDFVLSANQYFLLTKTWGKKNLDKIQSKPKVFKAGGGACPWNESETIMGYISYYIGCQKEITRNSVNVCDLVKEFKDRIVWGSQKLINALGL